MRSEKQKALEAAGWRFGDAADFLALTDEDRQMLDVRVDAALAVRRQREAMKLSQQELARRIKTSQPRIVKIEKAARDVTLDQILRAYAAAGGRIAIREVAGRPANKPKNRSKKAKLGKTPVQSKVQIDLITNWTKKQSG
jgi:transcriptional regulator with XRE-family HTH domain